MNGCGSHAQMQRQCLLEEQEREEFGASITNSFYYSQVLRNGGHNNQGGWKNFRNLINGGQNKRGGRNSRNGLKCSKSNGRNKNRL